MIYDSKKRKEIRPPAHPLIHPPEMPPTLVMFKDCRDYWRKHLSPGVKLGLGAVPLTVLEGYTPVTISSWLHADEQAKWRTLSQEKRRNEWLGGRLAVKQALIDLSGKTRTNWQILAIRSEENGRPFLHLEKADLSPFISISHSGTLAAGLAANLPCGLDIQQPVAKILSVKKYFVDREEEAALRSALPEGLTETAQLSLLWAAKEALRKMVRVSPLLGLKEIKLTAGQGHGTPDNPLILIFAADRAQVIAPAKLSVLSFMSDELAWALAFL